MNKAQVSADVAYFLACGGRIMTVPAGQKTGAVVAARARDRARERGQMREVFDYTEYSMRLGESGRQHSTAIVEASTKWEAVK